MSGRIFSRRTAFVAAWTRRCPRRELGAVGQGDRHQVVIRPVGIDQGDLEMIVLERDDHRTRVKPENLGEIRALNTPCFPRRGGLLREVGDEVSGPIDLDLGNQLLAQLRDPLDQIVPSLDGVERTGIHSPILVHHEIGIGRHGQRIVFGDLDVGLHGSEVLPRDQGLEDDVGRGDVLDQAATAVEEVHAGRGHDALVEVGAAAVVPEIIEADVERGDPEHLGPCELGFGHPHAGLRGRHDQRAGIAEPQRGREVDRKAKVGRLQRSGLELESLVQSGRRAWLAGQRQGTGTT